MSEIKSLAAPKASFDRRSVVKTAAWSVPVIAAAIAAPAAAASARTATVAFDYAAGNAITLPEAGSEGKPNPKNRAGTGPKGFYIQNTVGAISGQIYGTIIITPTAKTTAPANAGPEIGIYSVTSTGPKVTVGADTDASNGYKATFTAATTTVESKDLLTFSLGLNHVKNTPGGGGNITVLLNIPGRSQITLGPTPFTLT